MRYVVDLLRVRGHRRPKLSRAERRRRFQRALTLTLIGMAGLAMALLMTTQSSSKSTTTVLRSSLNSTPHSSQHPVGAGDWEATVPQTVKSPADQRLVGVSSPASTKQQDSATSSEPRTDRSVISVESVASRGVASRPVIVSSKENASVARALTMHPTDASLHGSLQDSPERTRRSEVESAGIGQLSLIRMSAERPSALGAQPVSSSGLLSIESSPTMRRGLFSDPTPSLFSESLISTLAPDTGAVSPALDGDLIIELDDTVGVPAVEPLPDIETSLAQSG